MSKLNLTGISKLGGYLLSNKGPLDVRTVVPEYSNLADLAADYYIYPGIIVYVKNDNKHYTYDGENWSELGGEITITDLNDYVRKSDIAMLTKDLYDSNGAAKAVKDELLNGAGDAYDTLKELGDLIDENVDAIEALETVATNKADKVHEHTYTNMDVTTQAVGGIAAGTSFNNVPITDLITSLLYPYAKPAISTFSLTPYAGIRKIGTSITLTDASVKVTKKSKAVDKVELCKGSTVLKSLSGSTITSSGTTLTFSGLSDTVSSNTTYTIKVYEIGNNTAAATSHASYTFVNPYYYGVIDSDAAITAALITGLTEDVTTQGSQCYSYTTTSTQCAVIAYPASYGELSQIKDANNFTQTWTKFSITINGVAYYVYKSGAAAATNFAYEFSY